jgi:hypothetical protein
MVSYLLAQGIITPQISVAGQCRNHPETLMMFIGSIVLQGGPRERMTLLTALRRYEAERGIEYEDRVDSQSPPEIVQSPLFSGNTAGPVRDIAFCSMALKEHGDKIGVIPNYDVRTISITPPHHLARLTFDGAVFEGKASTKKEARHVASKKACERFGIHFR